MSTRRQLKAAEAVREVAEPAVGSAVAATAVGMEAAVTAEVREVVATVVAKV